MDVGGDWSLGIVLGVIFGIFMVGMAYAVTRPAPNPYKEVGVLPDGRKVSYYRVCTPHDTQYIYMVGGVPVEVK